MRTPDENDIRAGLGAIARILAMIPDRKTQAVGEVLANIAGTPAEPETQESVERRKHAFMEQYVLNQAAIALHISGFDAVREARKAWNEIRRPYVSRLVNREEEA